MKEKGKNNRETVLRSVKEYGYFRSSTKHILLYDMASSQSGPQSGLWLSEREWPWLAHIFVCLVPIGETIWEELKVWPW